MANRHEVVIRDKDGKIVLHHAISTTSPTVDKIKTLLDLGADKNIKDSSGKSAWQIAVEKGDKAILKVLVK